MGTMTSGLDLSQQAARRPQGAARHLAAEEGLCVQMMHLGPYDSEPASLEAMDAFARENGYEPDISETRRHHEIYLSDPRKSPPEKWKTVLRHPIRKA